MRRDGAQPGDGIYVTGTPGDAGLALAAAFGKAAVAPEYRGYIQERLDRPEPRIAEGLALRGIASAAVDVSDGLAQDLGHILERSRVGARLDVDRLPLSPALTASLDRDAAIVTALAGGDDYELCFTVPPERVERSWKPWRRAGSAAAPASASSLGNRVCNWFALMVPRFIWTGRGMTTSAEWSGLSLSEADTRAKLIDPAPRARGWTEDLIRREETAGTIEIIGGKARRRARGQVLLSQ